MVKRMDLFKSPATGESQRARQGRIFTAWAFFSWQMMNTYHFFKPPDLRDLPSDPLPDPVKYPDWYGEIWIQYPNNQHPVPVHLGCIMKTRCALYHIINEIGYHTFNEAASKKVKKEGRPPISLTRALQFKAQLDAWMSNLPEPLTPRNMVFPTHYETQ